MQKKGEKTKTIAVGWGEETLGSSPIRTEKTKAGNCFFVKDPGLPEGGAEDEDA